MISKGIAAFLCFLTISLSGCVAPLANDPAFQPKLEEHGGPKMLYSIRSDQATAAFLLGSGKEQITQKYGAPAMSGTGVDKSGAPTSWIGYTYGRTYTHCDTNLNVTAVSRFTTVTLVFDAASKLVDVSLSRFQKFSSPAGEHDATEDEVARYLGAPEVLDIKAPAAPAASGTAEAGPGAEKVKGWKLGAEISELRSEFASKSGYTGRGVYVVSVAPDGLAARSGLAAGDVIVKVNGAATPTRDDLIDQLKSASLANPLEVQVFSKGRMRNVTVPAQQPAGDTSTI